MPRVNQVEKARNAQGPCGKCGTKIKPGDPYRWWKFRYGGRYVRCMEPACAPRPSDLTQSDYLGQLYALQERLGDCPRDGGAADELRSIADDLRALGDEQTEKRDNMPEGLQEGDTGQMLERRADACSNGADEIESAADDIENVCSLYGTLSDAATSLADKVSAIETAECDVLDREEEEADEDFVERVTEELSNDIDNAISGLSIEEE